jgi:hypothetical protein
MRVRVPIKPADLTISFDCFSGSYNLDCSGDLQVAIWAFLGLPQPTTLSGDLKVAATCT